MLHSNYEVRSIYYKYHVYCSYACAINMGSTVIITGGYWSKRIVSEYNEAGFIKHLEPMQTGRYTHGCSYFENNDGTKVFTI